MEYKVISTDSHCTARGQSWKERMPAQLRERLPQRPQNIGALGGLGQMAGRDPKDFTNKTVTEGDMRPGNWDPVEFLKDQSVDGVDGSVLYSGGNFAGPDSETRLASYQAHNDWLIEDFVSADAKQLIGLSPLPIEEGIEEAVTELRRCAGKGFLGATMPSHPAVPYHDPTYEPLWATAEELRMPLHIHRGSGSALPAHMKSGMEGGSGVASIVVRFTASKYAICYMLFTGVFTRHPGLKLVSGESDFGWLPFFGQCCDDMYNRQRHWAGIDFGEMPSDILKKQVFCTFMDDLVGMSLLPAWGTDNIMWASDYPHSVSTWPKSAEYIEKQMGGVTPDVRHKLLAGNAVQLYGLKAS